MIGAGHMSFIKTMLALALALAGGGTFAQSVAVQDSAFQRFLINTTGVGQQTVGFSGSGVPVPQTAGHTLAPDGSPNLRASATGILRNQAGGQIPVGLVGRVTPAVVARFIARATPLLGAAIIASDVADFASEQGFTLGFSDGSVTVSKPSDNACQDTPCREYYRSGVSLAAFGRGYYNITSACLREIQRITNSDFSYQLVSASGSGCTVASFYRGSFAGNAGLAFQSDSAPAGTVSPTTVPSSLSEFETYILQGNPYPVSSSVAEAILEARQLLNEPIPLAQPEVTGPASSPGSTSTTTKPDGSTVTITQTFNHTYNGPNISTTTTTTTSTVPAGGGPVQTETTVETPDPVQQQPEPFVMPCGVPGAPPCSVKVDETGVPTTVEDLADPQQRVDDTLQPLADLQADPIAFWPELPELTWNFALPTNCDVIPVPVFEEWMPPIDLCQFQPMFHSLMSVVWVLGGLFGAISLFWRNTLSTV